MRFSRLFFVSLAVAFVLASCSAPLEPTSSSGLSITISNQINARTLAPSLDMNPANYTITGTGPAGATFTVTSGGGTVTKTGLAFGSWTLVVNAINASSTLIGTGTATASVSTGTTTPVNIGVTPVTGTGTLSLGVSWPASQVQTPTINATLTPALGSVLPLSFVVSGPTASYSNPSVGNGYYTLGFTLMDNTTVVAGAVEVVRIVAGQTTSGTYSFTNVNAPGGSLQVGISANLQNPLNVTIAGATTTLAQGNSNALTASVSNYSGNVVYVWYVNGVAVGTGANYLFTAGTSGYTYRIDVTAFTADGTQAGSSTASILATPAPLAGAQWAQTLISATGIGALFASGATDSSGNSYVVGLASSGSYGFGNGVTVAGAGLNNNPLLVKYNSSGLAQWARSTSSGPSLAQFDGVAVDGAGNSYAVGNFIGVGPYGFGNGVTATGAVTGTNLVLVKYDSTGLALWAQTVVTGPGPTVLKAITTDSLGNCYAVGNLFGPGTFSFGNGASALSTSSGYASLIVKYNSAGQAQWAQTGASGSGFAGVTQDASGNVYAVGGIQGSGSYSFGNGVSVAGSATGSNTNVVVVKYSSAGLAQWARSTVSGTNISGFSGVASDGAGNVVAVGSLTGTGTFGFGNGVVVAGTATSSNPVMVKYDTAGVAQWAKSVTSGGVAGQFNSVVLDSSGSAYSAGYLYGTGPYGLGNGLSAAGGSTSNNPVIVKYTTLGVPQWFQISAGGGAASSKYNGVTIDAAGNTFALGYMNSTGPLSFGNGVTATGFLTGTNTLLVKFAAQ